MALIMQIKLQNSPFLLACIHKDYFALENLLFAFLSRLDGVLSLGRMRLIDGTLCFFHFFLPYCLRPVFFAEVAFGEGAERLRCCVSVFLFFLSWPGSETGRRFDRFLRGDDYGRMERKGAA